MEYLYFLTFILSLSYSAYLHYGFKKLCNSCPYKENYKEKEKSTNLNDSTYHKAL